MVAVVRSQEQEQSVRLKSFLLYVLSEQLTEASCIRCVAL